MSTSNQINKLKKRYHKKTFDAIKNAPFSIPWPIEPKYLKLENQEKEKDGDWEVLV